VFKEAGERGDPHGILHSAFSALQDQLPSSVVSDGVRQ